jgi:hypothetical protein
MEAMVLNDSPEHVGPYFQQLQRKENVVARKSQGSNTNPKAIQTKIQGLVSGFGSVYPPGKAIDVAGTSTPVSQIVQGLQTELGRYTATEAAHVSYEQSKQARDAAKEATLQYVAQVVSAVEQNLGDTNPQLAQFGLKPKTPRKKRTLEERLESAEKAKATREEKDGSSPSAAPTTTPPPAAGSGH